MPAPDLRIHDNQVACISDMDGIPVRSDVLSTDAKGEQKAPAQKRTRKILQKLGPALRHLLQPGESLLFVTKARSPLSVLEQLTAAWWTAALAACVIVATNKRILFFPVKSNGSWRESVRAVQWGDLNEIKGNGWLVRNVRFGFKNGTKSTYTNFRRDDAKKLTGIASALIPAASGEQTPSHGPVQLCPDCRERLTEGQYSCLNCGLNFKNEKTMILRSIFLPGGGYFYTGHPLVAILPAIIEALFAVEIIVILLAGLASPQAVPALLNSVLILGVFWALETGVTILHCRRYIRDFIPEKRDPTRMHQSTVLKTGD